MGELLKINNVFELLKSYFLFLMIQSNHQLDASFF